MATTMIQLTPRRRPWSLLPLSALVLVSAGALCVAGRVTAGLALIPTSVLAQAGRRRCAGLLLAAAVVGTGLVIRWGW